MSEDQGSRAAPDTRPTYMAHQLGFRVGDHGTGFLYSESTSCRVAFSLTVEKIDALIEKLHEFRMGLYTASREDADAQKPFCGDE